MTGKNLHLLAAGMLAAAWGGGAPAGAAIVASYSFDSNSAASADAHLETTATNVTFGPFSNSDGSPPSADINSNALRVNTGATGMNAGQANTLGGATGSIALGAYASFAVQSLGNTLEFTSLTFDHWFFNGSNTNASVAVMTSLTGFTAGNELVTFTFAGVTGNSTIEPRIVNLNVPALQDVVGNVEFRFYFFDNSDTGARAAFFDNIVVNANVVPEPAILGLAGFGAAGLVRRRR